MIPAGQTEHEGTIQCHLDELAPLDATLQQRSKVGDLVDATGCDLHAAHGFIFLENVLDVNVLRVVRPDAASEYPTFCESNPTVRLHVQHGKSRIILCDSS